MKNFLRCLILPAVLLIAAFAAPSMASAAPQPNDKFGSAMTIPAWGGTAQGYTYQATMSSGEFHWGNVGGQWGWDMWYDWTAPVSGQVRLDLCQTNPVNDTWYLAAADVNEYPAVLTWNVGTDKGCAANGMPQADFLATAGTQYRIAVGSKFTQNIFTYIRVAYAPMLEAAPTMIGSAAVGQTLRANPPTWKTATSTHTLTGPRWVRCAPDGSACTQLSHGTKIAETVSETYLVKPEDVGGQIYAEYTAENGLGKVDTRSASTATIAGKPVDADNDGIPDELITALGIPAGEAGYTALCTLYGLCKDNRNLYNVFNSWDSMQVINGAVLDQLLGSDGPDLLLANQRSAKNARLCDGANGNDVCLGSSGADTCMAFIGDDFCLGNKGNDTCVSKAGNDVCYGGEGLDKCLVQPPGAPAGIKFPPVPNTACFGGAGKDACLINVPAPIVSTIPWMPSLTCSGGTANDVCKAAAVKLVNGLKLKQAGVLRLNCKGDAGNDACGVAKSIPSPLHNLMTTVCSGGVGNDLCVAKGAANWAAGFLGAANAKMTCAGGAGIDTLWTLNGKIGDVITGGGQKGDVCVADRGDIVRGCGTTVLWEASMAELQLLRTRAQHEEFARQSTATVNGAVQSEEAMKEMVAQLNALTAKLNDVSTLHTNLMRSVAQP